MVVRVYADAFEIADVDFGEALLQLARCEQRAAHEPEPARNAEPCGCATGRVGNGEVIGTRPALVAHAAIIALAPLPSRPRLAVAEPPPAGRGRLPHPPSGKRDRAQPGRL